jgi:hypothetical protein
MRDQVQDMRTEIPPESREDAEKRRKLALVWASIYAVTWRSVRLLAILYIFNQYKNFFVQLLEGRSA